MVFRERTGVLVLRIWAEDDQTVRARIASTTDLDAGVPVTVVADSVDDIAVRVSAFLEAFTRETS
jgi:hypothetical protein